MKLILHCLTRSGLTTRAANQTRAAHRIGRLRGVRRLAAHATSAVLSLALPTATAATIAVTSVEAFPNGRTSSDPPANAVDGDINTYTWATESFNADSPSYLAVGFEGTGVNRVRLWKSSDGGGGANIKNIVIEYTTDADLPLSSRTWQNVTGLRSGYHGTEGFDASTVNADGTVTGDVHDSPSGDGFGSLIFNTVTATGIRIGFNNPDSIGSNHYRVGELQVLCESDIPDLAIFTVTNTADNGAGSLRQAIIEANASAGADIIAFKILGEGVQTIAPLSALPTITDTVTIDGYTQPGASPGRLGTSDPPQLMIELTGANLSAPSAGLTISAASCRVAGLVINGFGSEGLVVCCGAASNRFEGNFIGTDTSGRSARPNGGAGIYLDSPNNTVGGTTMQARNLISGNNGDGILVWGETAPGNLIQGNLIGTDITGREPLGNAFSGVTFRSASANIVGGTTASARNIISANGLGGVQFHDAGFSSNVVQGNFIGADITGTNALGNGEDGILLWGGSDNSIGGSAAGAGNVIVGNRRYGIVVYLGAQRTRIQGNYLGTDASGTQALGNTGPGIGIGDADNSIIGGTALGEANTIAFNGGPGVQIGPGANNTVRANSIYLNGALGIELDSDGVTPNDAGDMDSGGNQRQNYPVLVTVVNDTSTRVQGTLNSMPDTTFQLDFFASDSADASGYGEGQVYLGSASAHTDGAGNADLTYITPRLVPQGQWITGTATDPLGNTSEFSPAIQIPVTDPTDTDTDGLPDEWEKLIVRASLTDTLRSIADVFPEHDFDLDHRTNLQEYQAGTDPIAPNFFYPARMADIIGAQQALDDALATNEFAGAAAWVKQWTWRDIGEFIPPPAGESPPHAGAVRIHPTYGVMGRLFRYWDVPANDVPVLHLEFRSWWDCYLAVFINAQRVWETQAAGNWQNLDLDLRSYAGRNIQIEVVHTVGGNSSPWYSEHLCLDQAGPAVLTSAPAGLVAPALLPNTQTERWWEGWTFDNGGRIEVYEPDGLPVSELFDGESYVITTHPPSVEQPYLISQQVSIPAANAYLRLVARSDNDFIYKVYVGGELAASNVVQHVGWTTNLVDLTPWGGTATEVRIEHWAGGAELWYFEASHWADLTMKEAIAPVIVHVTATKLIHPGETAEFAAHALGAAPLNYQWLRDGTEIPGATEPTLTIRDFQAADAGAYTIRVSNSHGTAVSSTVYPGWVIAFVDPALEAAVRNNLGQPEGEITTVDMARLTGLIVRRAGITNLTGLEHAVNLTELGLDGNEVEDVRPLAQLSNLTKLWLYGNTVQDLTPLSGLTGLTTLGLEWNQITSVAALANLTHLEWVSLVGNQIPDVGPLAGLTNLTSLYLYGNKLQNISALASLKQLRELGIDNNWEITSIAPLAGLGELRELRLANNRIEDCSPLAGLTNLTYLSMGNNLLQDISPLAGLSQLKTLEFDRNKVHSIAPLAGCTQLTELWINDNEIADPSPLAGLVNLTRLDLGYNRATNIAPLAGMTQLTWLNLGGGNQITDVQPLAGLTELGSLNLWGNTAVDLGPLAGLTKLTWLDLGYNHATEITPLAGMTQLTWLNLGSNDITDIAPLSALTGLTTLVVSDNAVVDLSPLEGLAALTWLDLGYNRVADLAPLAACTQLTDLWITDNESADMTPLSGQAKLARLYIAGNWVTNLDFLVGLTALQNVDVRRNLLSVRPGDPDRLVVDGLLARGVTVEYDPQDTAPKVSFIADQLTTAGQPTPPIAFRVADNLTPAADLTVTASSSNQSLLPDSGITLSGSGAHRTVVLRPGATFGGTVSVTLWVSDGAESGSMTFQLKIEGDPGTQVHFVDAALEAAVRNNLGQPEGEITTVDMARLTGLIVRRAGITNLTGLEHAVNLTELGLDGNEVEDVRPLAQLTNLTKLWLYGNTVQDLTPLSGLTGLTTLGLEWNQIASVAALANLTHLEWLSLVGNQIPDVGPLAGLTNLTSLYLYGNKLQNISALASLKQLRELGIDNNWEITSIAPLAGLGELRELRLANNRIEDCSPLAGLTNLTYLSMGNNLLREISPLAGLSQLKTLELDRNKVHSIAPLANCTQLTELWLNENEINDPSPLAGLANLTRLELAGNWLTNLDPLANLTQLTRADVRRNLLNLGTGAPARLIVDGLLARGVTVEYDPQNTAPEISFIADQQTTAGQPTAPIAFRVGDNLTPAADLTVTASSSNPWLLPGAAITFGGSGTDRTVVLSPSADRAGTVSVTLWVSDGVESGSATFQLRVEGPPTTASPVFGWGLNESGQLDVPAGYTNLLALVAGFYHSLGLSADGLVVGWGGNANGAAVPPPGLSNVVALSAGAWHSLALTTDGRVTAWGHGGTGQTNVPPGLSNVVAIAGGRNHSLALLANGTVVAWGVYSDGASWVPMSVPEGLSNVVAISSKRYHNLALTAAGTVVAWGFDNFGQTVVPAGLSRVAAVAAGGYHSMALTEDGQVVCWGAGGPGATGLWQYGQSIVPAGLSNVVAIAAGFTYSMALQADGTVVCWGQYSDADGSFWAPMVTPSDITNVVQLAAGYHSALALQANQPPGPRVEQATLSDARARNGVFSVSVPTAYGFVYALEFKESLDDPAWTALPLVAGDGSVKTLEDPHPTSPRRFYRVRRW